MFPHTITIYRHKEVNDADVYEKQILKSFYTVQNKTLSQDSKGFSNSKPTSIISSPEMAQKYGTEWTVELKDRIVIGNGADITSFDDIPNAIVVQSIEVNVIGSDVDNITILGN